MLLLRRYRVGLVLLGMLVAVGFLVVYRLKDQQARAVTRPRPDVLVGVVTPERRTMEIKLAFTADIVPAKQAAIFSKVSGYIRRIHADRGDFVEAGQVLVEHLADEDVRERRAIACVDERVAPDRLRREVAGGAPGHAPATILANHVGEGIKPFTGQGAD